SATAATLTCTGGAGPAPNGPTSVGNAVHGPGATSGALCSAMDTSPVVTPSTCGPLRTWATCIRMGACALATMVSASVSVGTTTAGAGCPASSGSWTVSGVVPTSASSDLVASRASTKKSFCLAPVFWTWIVAVTGCPAGSVTSVEPGTPSVETGT